MHSVGNPFTEKSPLKSLLSSALVTEKAMDDLQHFPEKGQKCFEEFVDNRLLPTSTLCLGPHEEAKTKDLFQLDGKTKGLCGDKVVKIREEHELLGRFLIIQGS